MARHTTPTDNTTMRTILIPIDGSTHANRALAQLLQQRGHEAGLQLHLLNVQTPNDSRSRTCHNADELKQLYEADGLAQLAPARQLANNAGVAYQHHIRIGHPAQAIVRCAKELHADEIVMGTHGRTGLMKLVMGSVAADVSQKSDIPVTLVK